MNALVTNTQPNEMADVWLSHARELKNRNTNVFNVRGTYDSRLLKAERLCLQAASFCINPCVDD